VRSREVGLARWAGRVAALMIAVPMALGPAVAAQAVDPSDEVNVHDRVTPRE